MLPWVRQESMDSAPSSGLKCFVSQKKSQHKFICQHWVSRKHVTKSYQQRWMCIYYRMKWATALITCFTNDKFYHAKCIIRYLQWVFGYIVLIEIHAADEHCLQNLLYFPFVILHRFIESNKLETTSRYAFRGLRDLTHLYVSKIVNTIYTVNILLIHSLLLHAIQNNYMMFVC